MYGDCVWINTLHCCDSLIHILIHIIIVRLKIKLGFGQLESVHFHLSEISVNCHSLTNYRVLNVMYFLNSSIWQLKDVYKSLANQ